VKKSLLLLLKLLKLSTSKTCFIQHWHSDNLYKHFKTSFGITNYINILDKSGCKRLIAFRTSKYRLPIETGRWQNIPSHDRNCIFNCNDTGDEYHYLIRVHVIKQERAQCIHKYYYQRPNVYTIFERLQSKHVPTVRKLSVFCYLIMKKFK